MSFLKDLPKFRDGRTRRLSSWDRTGKNRDCWTIEAGAKADLAKINSPGIIRHTWFTISCEDPLYLRKTVLRMYWDGMNRPSVEVPVGDFFGVGHANDRCDDYSSVAYWYQDLPHKPFPPFPKMEERLPGPDATVYPVDLPIPPQRKTSGSPIEPELL